MNKNRENYKKAIDQIHVDSNLKDKVLENIKEKNKKKNSVYYFRYVASIAAVAIVAVAGVSFFSKSKKDMLNMTEQIKEDKDITQEEKDLALENVSIKRFSNIEELREKLASDDVVTKGIEYSITLSTNAVEESIESDVMADDVSDLSSEEKYSQTNNQVEGVDEADIVKTDGKYIYYSNANRVFIVDTNLELKSIIKNEEEDEIFAASQIFVNGNKLVIFGSSYNSSRYYGVTTMTNSIVEDRLNVYERPKTYAKIYDIQEIENPKLLRTMEVSGYYKDARMIGNDIYFVSNCGIYFYKDIDEMTDEEILPFYKDTNISEENIIIDANRIACFDDCINCEYSIIAGFNLNSEDGIKTETFFGFGNDMYVSENNMYIICTKYSNRYYNADTLIYKFKLENSNVIAQASAEVEGTINNQFSLDEYEGNLRIATTVYKYNQINYEEKMKTRLTILNENLEKIGEIEDLIKDEKIYAVRFIGKVGYIVTFEQVDPLWVIDLSDPTKPVVKGELEIPGYSSYLHPYDETHIIGIGYDVKSNGYGGVTNDTIKLSMFDVSDLENPKEIFKINFDSENASSNIMYDHKALFFNKSKNLIGFPINVWKYRNQKTGMLLYKIDLENNKFEEISSLVEDSNYDYAERAIYINDNIYVLYNDFISKFSLTTFEKLGTLELDLGYDD